MGLKLKEDEINFEIERQRESGRGSEGWKRMYIGVTRESSREREREVGGVSSTIVYNRVDREIFITPFLSYAYK